MDEAGQGTLSNSMIISGWLRVRVEYLLVRLLVGILGMLPWSWSMAAGRFLGYLSFYALGHLRHVGERNLEIAFPERSASERQRILRASFDSLGRLLGLFCHFPGCSPEDLCKLIEHDKAGEARFIEAKSRGKGLLFITAHLGAWELLPLYYSAIGYPFSFLVRPLENPLLDRWVDRVRTRFGNKALDKKAAGLSCLRLLKNGGTLGILPDLNSLPQEGIFVPFFGKLGCTTLAVAAFALPTDATIFSVFAPWDPIRKKFVLVAGPDLELVRTGNRDRDLAINTARMAFMFEKVIRAYPEQWLWIHDRWHAIRRPQDRVFDEHVTLTGKRKGGE
jgi:Kdo2-lipid IVA lauroyltransferase/acyltransferase